MSQDANSSYTLTELLHAVNLMEKAKQDAIRATNEWNGVGLHLDDGYVSHKLKNE